MGVLGCCTRVGPAYYALAGRLAGLLRASGPRSRAGLGCEAFSSFLFFSVFFFYFLDLNSNLVFKFGFQFGAPYSLEFRYEAHHILLYIFIY